MTTWCTGNASSSSLAMSTPSNDGGSESLDDARRSATSIRQSAGERRALRGARAGARLDEVQARPLVERRIAAARGAEDVGRQPAVSGAGFDEIEAGLEAPARHLGTRGLDRRMPAISAIWISSSSPNTGPTSTLVKKSPARPDRWAARA